MGNTSRYGWAYPEVTDPPNTALHLKNLANAVETTVGALTDSVAAAAVPVGGEWAANAAQSLVSGTATKLTFPTNTQASNGITFNGTDTWTIGTSRPYNIYAQCRKSIAASGDSMAVTTAPYSDATLLLPGMATTGYGDVFVSGTIWLAAGTQISCYYYSGSATANSVTTRFAKFKIWGA
jgi:hypothetical protein